MYRGCTVDNDRPASFLVGQHWFSIIPPSLAIIVQSPPPGLFLTQHAYTKFHRCALSGFPETSRKSR